ncbi:MAG: sodium/glutamate symporter [Lachnospiraceae bacterium]|nr:sodium/glutamate symporter [Lachnospiraceae bacterium]
MLAITLNMYQTLAVAVIALLLGSFIRKRVSFLERFCIPAPVVGGLIFAIATCILYVTGLMEITFTDTLREVCMVFFFTSVGFQANLKILKTGGKSLLIFLVLVIILITGQNILAVGLSKVLSLDALVGLCTGSIPMVGGHGTAGAFGPVLEDFGLVGATTVCTAAATYGLISGSLIGGPIANHLILKHDLLKTAVMDDDSILVEDEAHHVRNLSNYAPATYQLVLAVGAGTLVSYFLSKTGMTFPIYIGAMIVAAVIRNVGEYTGKFEIHMGEINDIGGIMLSLFLGIAMITLKIWQLAELALPLLILLIGQTIFMYLYANFVIFNVMGRNYDAAVITAGTCGFGMGATPNAMANMQAICDKFAPSIKAYILIPIVGSLFADFINSLVITFFINLV